MIKDDNAEKQALREMLAANEARKENKADKQGPHETLAANVNPSVYAIREDGKNGTVEVLADRIIRTRKKHLGKDDIQTFPIRAITGVQHDRKTLRTDEVRITFGSVSYEWKVSDAERFVADIHSKMFD